MQVLDIDRLIELARQSSEEFESMKLILISQAILSCEKPEQGRQLQTAITMFQSDPAGKGVSFLRQTIESMSGDPRLLGDCSGSARCEPALVVQP